MRFVCAMQLSFLFCSQLLAPWFAMDKLSRAEQRDSYQTDDV